MSRRKAEKNKLQFRPIRRPALDILADRAYSQSREEGQSMPEMTEAMRQMARESVRKSREKPIQEELDSLEAPERRGQAEKMARTCPISIRPMYFRALRAELPLRAAVRVACLACMGWQREEVKACSSYGCPLWAYRPGTKRPVSL
jgi:hypothetical protein